MTQKKNRDKSSSPLEQRRAPGVLLGDQSWVVVSRDAETSVSIEESGLEGQVRAVVVDDSKENLATEGEGRKGGRGGRAPEVSFVRSLPETREW